MSEQRVGSVRAFKDGEKRVILIGGVEVGIFQLDGEFYAWRNVCPHHGGPVCQGRIFTRVIANVAPDRTVHGCSYDESKRHIVCPWHGGEFNIRTGHHAGTDALSLDPIPAIIRDGEVFLRVD